MALSTIEELEARYTALTGRIVAIDVDISREIDTERRGTLQARRTELATEREKVAADIAILHPGYSLAAAADASTIERRVSVLERDVRKLWGIFKPGPRQVVSRAVFYMLIVVAWSMWMVKEIRDWLVFHPAQAIAVSLALVVAALIIRWLPEDDHDQR